MAASARIAAGPYAVLEEDSSAIRRPIETVGAPTAARPVGGVGGGRVGPLSPEIADKKCSLRALRLMIHQRHYRGTGTTQDSAVQAGLLPRPDVVSFG
jgi:hypothetical protein